MKTIFNRACNELKHGNGFVLCSIIASSGSAPRGSGAKMAVFCDGTVLGTIGGGAVEHRSIELAKEALSAGRSKTKAFSLRPNSAADIGMVCGGNVSVYFQYFSGNDPDAVPLFDAICSALEEKKDSWLITAICDDKAVTGIYDAAHSLRFMTEDMLPEILPHLCSKSVLTGGSPSLYIEPLTRAETVYVFGGGHVSAALVPVLSQIGFSVCVYEEREDFCTKERFPDAVTRITGEYGCIASHIRINPCDYVIIMTRGHEGDFDVLYQALQTDAAYIGMIGSRHKVALTNKRLLEKGIPESELSRIHSPIGLSIGAETPAEIAISIAAELIQHRAAAKEKT